MAPAAAAGAVGGDGALRTQYGGMGGSRGLWDEFGAARGLSIR